MTLYATPSLRIGTGLRRQGQPPSPVPPEAPALGATPATRTSCHPAASKRVSIRGFNPKEVSRPGSATSAGRTKTWGQPFPCHPCPEAKETSCAVMDAQNSAVGAELEGVRVTRWTRRSERRPCPRAGTPGQTDRRKRGKRQFPAHEPGAGGAGRWRRPHAFHLCSCAGEVRPAPAPSPIPGQHCPAAPAAGLRQPVYFQGSHKGSAHVPVCAWSVA